MRNLPPYKVWLSSTEMDILGIFDSRTGAGFLRTPRRAHDIETTRFRRCTYEGCREAPKVRVETGSTFSIFERNLRRNFDSSLTITHMRGSQE